MVDERVPPRRLTAAPRDASWYRNPNVYSFKAVHVDDGDEFAACNPGVPLGSLTWSDAAEVNPVLRCKRRACQLLYAEADRRKEER